MAYGSSYSIIRKFAVLAAVMLFCFNCLSESVPERYLEIVMNTYAPAPWNGGYGHFDFSIRSGDGYPSTISLEFDGKFYESEFVTISYGPENGEDSQGIVHINMKKPPRVPEKQLVILNGITDADMIAFMDLFISDFADFDTYEDGAAVFRVKDENFAVYSVREHRNCAKAMMHLVDMFPGGMDQMAQNNPDEYAALVSASEKR